MSGAPPPGPAGAPRLGTVADDVVAESPLRGRLVVSIDASGSGAAEAVVRSLSDRSEVVRTVSAAVFEAGIPRMIGNHQLSRDAGLGTLVPLPVLLAAVRRLVDALLTAPSAEGGLVVEAAGAGTDPALVRAVYPEATVVVVGGDSSGLADIEATDDEAAGVPDELARAIVEAAQRRVEPTGGGGHGAEWTDALRDRLVLVFGVPRSGTTWLEQLLLAHPRTAGVDEGETWIFQAVHGFWENLEGRLGLHALVDRSALAGALRRFCDDLFLHHLRESGGATHFVEKTPGHAWLLPWIGEVYPDAWCIHLVRDGRDVSRSVAEMVHGTDDVRTAAQRWAGTIRRVAATSGGLARFREVRYEHLLDRPVDTAAEILTWAGVDVSDADRHAIESERSVRVSRHGTSGDVGAGKWATMTAAERRIVLATAGPVLAELGYVAVDEVRRARWALRRPAGALMEWQRRRSLTSGRRPRG